jgi:PRTRC genetic system protein A
MKPVGYLLNAKEGLSGEPGLYYDYILAGNGLFIRAKNALIEASVCIGPAEVRGLLPLEGKLELVHGKIPSYIYDLVFSAAASNTQKERYLAVTWGDMYLIKYPSQKGEAGGVDYERLPNTVLDVHSHGGMGAFFSSTDNRDEQGLRLSLVFGKLDTIPEYDLRIGVYGYYAPVSLEKVFK